MMKRILLLFVTAILMGLVTVFMIWSPLSATITLAKINEASALRVIVTVALIAWGIEIIGMLGILHIAIDEEIVKRDRRKRKRKRGERNDKRAVDDHCD